MTPSIRRLIRSEFRPVSPVRLVRIAPVRAETLSPAEEAGKPVRKKPLWRRGYFPSLLQMYGITRGHLAFSLFALEEKVRGQVREISEARDPSGLLQIDVASRFPSAVAEHPGKPADVLRLVIGGDGGEGDNSQYLMVEALEEALGSGQGVFLYAGDVYPYLSQESLRRGFTEPYKGVPHKVFGCGNHEYWGLSFRLLKVLHTLHPKWWKNPIRALQHWYDSNLIGSFGDETQYQALGRPPHLHYSVDHPNLRYLWLDSGAKGRSIDEPQLRWFQSQLEDASLSNRPVIVGFHHNFAADGEEVTGDFRSQVEPLLARYRVPLILTHHLHNFQVYDHTYRDHSYQEWVQGNLGGFLMGTHRFGDKPKQPRLLYPTPAQSRDRFKGSFFGRFKLTEFLEALNEHDPRTTPFYAGFTVLEASPGGVVVAKHVGRDGYFADPKTIATLRMTPEGATFEANPSS